MNCRPYNYFFMNFANKANMEIISVLINEPMNVSAIIEKTNQEQSAVSHRLKNLTHCNILNVEQKGRERIYSLNKKTIIPILKLVEEHTMKNCTYCDKK